jgi:hypothetical protein
MCVYNAPALGQHDVVFSVVSEPISLHHASSDLWDPAMEGGGLLLEIWGMTGLNDDAALMVKMV